MFDYNLNRHDDYPLWYHIPDENIVVDLPFEAKWSKQGKRNEYGETEFQNLQVRGISHATYEHKALSGPDLPIRYRSSTAITEFDLFPGLGTPKFTKEAITQMGGQPHIVYRFTASRSVASGRAWCVMGAVAMCISPKPTSVHPKYPHCGVAYQNFKWGYDTLDELMDELKTYLRESDWFSNQTIQGSSVSHRESFYRMNGVLEPAKVPVWAKSDEALASMTNLWESNLFSPRELHEVQGNALISVVNNAKATDVINIENILQLLSAVRDFPKLPSTLVKSIRRAVRANDAKTVSKLAADAKLSYDYSLKTTYSDTRDLLKAVRKSLRSGRSYNISRGRSSISSKEHDFSTFTISESIDEAYKVYYGNVDESTLPLYRRLVNIGLDPSFEHVWNIIPYSFVVDWVLPTQKVLQQLDYEKAYCTLPIRAVTHGRWKRFRYKSDNVIAEISAYKRDLANDLPDFPYFLPSFSPDMNWWNGAALIIQRLR